MIPTTPRRPGGRVDSGPSRQPPHVVVVGGGISGLAAAYFLGTAAIKIKVTVLEQDARIGGKLEVADVGGIPVDQGAESLLARDSEVLDLVRAIGLGDDLVEPATTGASIWSRGALRSLPAGTLLGIPTDLRALATSGVMSWRGLARIPLDHVLATTAHAAERDVPVGWYVRRRLGREVADRLVDPILGGVYAGRADELSLAATLPGLATAVRQHRSLLDAARLARAERPVFRSLRGGLGRLPGALAAASGASIRTGRAVRELRRAPLGWQILAGPAREPELITADAVVLSCPAPASGRLLTEVAPTAAQALAGLGYASVALVTMIFDNSAVRPRLHGSGFLVPAVEGRVVKAVTYLSEKWSWLGLAAGPRVVIRASVGRHGEISDVQPEPEELVRTVAADVSAMAGTPPRPQVWNVRKWGGGLPQYTVGHPQRVADVRRAVGMVPGLAVCGAAYDGVGIAACVASARAAADQVLDHLGARTTMA